MTEAAYDLPSLETLAREHQARGMAGVMVSPETLLSLVVKAKELGELEGAIAFLNERGVWVPLPKGPTK